MSTLKIMPAHGGKAVLVVIRMDAAELLHREPPAGALFQLVLADRIVACDRNVHGDEVLLTEPPPRDSSAHALFVDCNFERDLPALTALVNRHRPSAR